VIFSFDVFRELQIYTIHLSVNFGCCKAFHFNIGKTHESNGHTDGRTDVMQCVKLVKKAAANDVVVVDDGRQADTTAVRKYF